MIKVSVIVPVYNCEMYLDKCMESLMGQTCKDFEILLMVGFCKDRSLQKCLEWQKKDARIVVLSRKDNSLGDARNYALKMARGKYVAYLDADDFYREDYIEKMCIPLEDDETINISCCGYECFEKGFFSAGRIPDQEGTATLDFRKYIDRMPAAAVWLKLFRREWLVENQVEMFDGCCEDQSLHFVLAALIKKVYFIREPLYKYNIGNEGSLVKTLKSRMDYGPATEYAIEYLEKRKLYGEIRHIIRNQVCLRFKDFLQETNYDQSLLSVCKQFLEKRFPEVIEEYKIYSSREMCLKDRVVLYGAGTDGEKFLDVHGAAGISYIVDKNPILQGREKYGLFIRPVEYLYEEPEEVLVIVASGNYYYEIVKDLRDKGLSNICTPEDFCKFQSNKKNH